MVVAVDAEVYNSSPESMKSPSWFQSAYKRTCFVPVPVNPKLTGTLAPSSALNAGLNPVESFVLHKVKVWIFVLVVVGVMAQ